MRHTRYKLIWFLLLTIISSVNVLAQATKTSDQLFSEARNMAKEKSNYPKIIDLLKQALVKSPNYSDVRIFLGRVYTWNDQLDSARYQFNQVLAKEPKNLDALSASFDVEYWNNNYDNALVQVNKIVAYYPDSVSYSIKKAKVLTGLKKPTEAMTFMEKVIAKSGGNKEATNYYNELKESYAASTRTSSDDLFQLAIKEVRANKNYPKAIEFLKQGISQSPNYDDLKIYLGRIYTWTDKLDSARYLFNQVLAKDPKNIEAIEANFDLEYWNDNYVKAMDHANAGLLYYPDSASFNIKKARVLMNTKGNRPAIDYLSNYLKEHPNSADTLKKYFTELRLSNTKNMVDLSYEYVYFDKRFDQPWHFVMLDYTRNTSIGSVTARINYANRFGTNGLQGEVEAYPSLTKGIYAYVGAAFADVSIFPKFRFGTSLYYTLPKGFDAETGFRYLDYNPTKTYIYVLALGKYIGNYYINFKTYLSPDVDVFSHSHTLSVRYYFSDRFNFIGGQIGTGVSPDDRARNITGLGNLRSYKVGINFSKDVARNLTLNLNGLLYYEEYSTDTWGNQISGGISIAKRF